MNSDLTESKQEFKRAKPLEDLTQKKPDAAQGDLLKKAREKSGLSLETIHEETKIPMDALRAIEEGYTIRTLSPFYITGFVKIYAQYLGINVEDIIDDYHSEKLPKYIKKNVEDFELPLWITDLKKHVTKKNLLIAGGVFLGLFLMFKVINIFANRPAKPEIKNIKAGKKEASTKKIKKISAASKKKSASKKIEKKQAPVQFVKTQKLSATSSQTNPSRVITPAKIVTKDVTLTVRAKESSFLIVKSDNTIVFQATLRRGSVETWMADEKIELSGKRINQLEFELNGKMIGALGRKERRAKRVIVTKDGLSVSK
ncbi:hypothetical protein MNBD_BACTEROID05-1283 [hydrothermal vent metagenome]|uniref:Uncharacterized protein n=1 Tax=hydrothermal vent metagenome TaxID=652676 RepID=A0A3B0T441_9ZZZZ